MTDKLRIYMFDGVYQSLICFFMPYLLFAPATFSNPGGQDVNDNRQIGVHIANAAIIVVNTYILLNTYRWDWLTTLITVISILLIFAWTGIYTSFTASFQFYKAAAEVYGTLNFWAVTVLTVIVCLLPRFTAKAWQKLFMPRDVDLVRSLVREGHFKYLDEQEPEITTEHKPAMSDSSESSSLPNGKAPEIIGDRPTSGDPFRNTQGSDEYAQTLGENRMSTMSNPFTVRGNSGEYTRHSYERTRPSFDRLKTGGGDSGRMRDSFERSRDFTSARGLMKVESSRSYMSQREQQSEDDKGR